LVDGQSAGSPIEQALSSGLPQYRLTEKG